MIEAILWAIWVIGGIFIWTYIKYKSDGHITVNDLICIIILGFFMGWFGLILLFFMSDIGNKVIWRKK